MSQLADQQSRVFVPVVQMEAMAFAEQGVFSSGLRQFPSTVPSHHPAMGFTEEPTEAPGPLMPGLYQPNPVTTALIACCFHPRITQMQIRSLSITVMRYYPALQERELRTGSGALCLGSHSESPSQSEAAFEALPAPH